MSPYRLHFVGTQLLFLSHMAHSFILLTANMEDVKKIAQKFVSNSLAEKIAEFVAKATEQMVANVSAENERNADDIQYLSEEHNNLELIVRQREENPNNNAQEPSKYVEFEKDYKLKESTEVTTEKYKAQAINWEREVNEMNDNKYSKEIEVKPKDNEQKKEKRGYDQKDDYEQKKDYDHKADYKQKEDQKEDYDKKDYGEKEDYDKKVDYDQEKADYEQSKLDDKKKIKKERKLAYEQQKLIYEQQLEKQKHEPKTDKNYDYEPKRKPTNKNAKQQKLDKNQKLRKLKPRDTTTSKIIDSTILYHQVLRKLVNRGHRLASFDSGEMKSNKTQSTFRGFNINRALTTAKSRDEFDQYDNPNYPKAEFIATSGPVVLPKVAMVRPWWEREMTMPVMPV